MAAAVAVSEKAALKAAEQARLMKEYCVAHHVPLVYIFKNINNVPKNVPVTLFNFQFCQHEKKGPWHAVSAVADTGANRTIFSHNLLMQAGIAINTCRRENVNLVSKNTTMSLSGSAFIGLKTASDSKKDYVVIKMLMSDTLKEDNLISYNDLKRLRVVSDDFLQRRTTTTRQLPSTTLTLTDSTRLQTSSPMFSTQKSSTR